MERISTLTVELRLHPCVLCGDERPIERPECLDGHGEDCPEAFCADCGAALLVGALAVGRVG